MTMGLDKHNRNWWTLSIAPLGEKVDIQCGMDVVAVICDLHADPWEGPASRGQYVRIFR